MQLILHLGIQAAKLMIRESTTPLTYRRTIYVASEISVYIKNWVRLLSVFGE